MPDPISERIAQKVLARMQGIVAPAYPVTVSATRYLAHKANPVANNVLWVMEFDDEPEDPPGGYFQYLKSFGVACIVMLDPSDATIDDARVNILRGAIEKAAMSDPFWDDLASNTFLRGLQRFDPNEETYGAIVYFDVQYRVRETDPTAQ